MSYRRRVVALIFLVTAAECGGTGPTAVPQLVCDAANTRELTLIVGAYASVDMACMTVDANASATDSAEYLVVAQSVAGLAGAKSAFVLQGNALPPPIVAARVAPSPGLPDTPVAAQFDGFLRQVGRSWNAGAAGPTAVSAARAPGAERATVAPAIGSSRAFRVCATLTCTTFDAVTATAQSVGAHVAIYVDPSAPAGGLDAAYLDSLQQTFDQRVFAVDTAAFGRESDIDTNGVVVVLMTGIVNKLVTPAQCLSSGYVTGFFYPGDVMSPNPLPHTPGEVMYTIVPDPAGTLSCSHSRARVEQLLPATLLHEFEHMINFNQHALVRRGPAEDVWLDEALAKYAEELGGRTFLPGDSASFYSYADGDLFDAYEYLAAPGDHYLVTTTDQDLGDVGAGWLLMRYVVDQFGPAITPKLVQTSATGAGNLSLQTGVPFPVLAAQWALANWVSDLPGFDAPPGLRYTSWQFRATFDSLNARNPGRYAEPFPLVPVIATGSVNLSGVLRAGSGVYVRCVQPPGAKGFTLAFGAPGPTAMASVMVPRLEVIRVR
jgi:hypothetical protein